MQSAYLSRCLLTDTFALLLSEYISSDTMLCETQINTFMKIKIQDILL